MVEKAEDKRALNIFSIAAFLNDFGSDMIYPVWPLFVTTVLGADLTALGIIDGLGDAVVSISQAISGYFSDKWRKRKVFIWSGYFLGSASRVGYALAPIWQYLVPLKILDRAGKMRDAPRDAVIADASTIKNRGRNFGLLNMMDNLGATCGIVACILLVGWLGYRNLFLIAAIPSLLAVLLVLLFIRERKTKDIYKGFSLRELDWNFRILLLSSAVFALGFFSYSFLLVYASDFGFQSTQVPVLYLVFTAVASLFSLPFGRLADRLRMKKVLALSYIFFALMCAGFIFLNSYIGIVLMFVLYGLHLGAKMPVQTAFVSELAPVNYRASTLGAFQMVMGLCAFPASLFAGVLWQNFGKMAPFYSSLLLTGIALVLLLFVNEKKAH